MIMRWIESLDERWSVCPIDSGFAGLYSYHAFADHTRLEINLGYVNASDDEYELASLYLKRTHLVPVFATCYVERLPGIEVRTPATYEVMN